ncbi:hypothetical protein GN956_G11410 [Arapaima gigas]
MVQQRRDTSNSNTVQPFSVVFSNFGHGWMELTAKKLKASLLSFSQGSYKRTMQQYYHHHQAGHLYEDPDESCEDPCVSL